MKKVEQKKVRRYTKERGNGRHFFLADLPDLPTVS